MAHLNQPQMSNRHGGICINCSRMPTCGLQPGNFQPVHFCEEFDAGASPAANAPLPTNRHGFQPGIKTAAAAAAGNGSRPNALCVNCVHVERCTYPKPDTGIWYCEEYA